MLCIPGISSIKGDSTLHFLNFTQYKDFLTGTLTLLHITWPQAFRKHGASFHASLKSSSFMCAYPRLYYNLDVRVPNL